MTFDLNCLAGLAPADRELAVATMLKALRKQLADERARCRALLTADGTPEHEIRQVVAYGERMHAEQLAGLELLLSCAATQVH